MGSWHGEGRRGTGAKMTAGLLSAFLRGTKYPSFPSRFSVSHIFTNAGIPAPHSLYVYVVFKLVHACSHVCGYMGRPAANTKGSPLYLLSQGLSERAALRCCQFTPCGPYSGLEDRLPCPPGFCWCQGAELLSSHLCGKHYVH